MHKVITFIKLFASKYEVIIVDNNSKDNTLKIIQKYPVISLIESRIQSSYATRNTGLKRSNGEIIAFTDSDCIADKDWILKVGGMFSGREDRLCSRKDRRVLSIKLHRGVPGKDRCTVSGKHEISTLRTDSECGLQKRRSSIRSGCFEENWISGGDADLTWRMLLAFRLSDSTLRRGLDLSCPSINAERFFQAANDLGVR